MADDAPGAYSAFHILLTLFGAGLAVFFARIFSKKYGPHQLPNRIFAVFSFPAGCSSRSWSSISRHFYMSSSLTATSTGGTFHSSSAASPCTSAWQHRSCAPNRHSAAPQLFSRLRSAWWNHALAVPPGLMHPYWTMTLHGFIWHFILLLLGLLSCMSGSAGHTRRDYLEILPFFLLCCLIACVINIAAGPTADADMFYISPFHPSSQPVSTRLPVRSVSSVEICCMFFQ